MTELGILDDAESSCIYCTNDPCTCEVKGDKFHNIFVKLVETNPLLTFSLLPYSDGYRRIISDAIKAQEDFLISLDAIHRLTVISEETWMSIASIYGKIQTGMLEEQHHVHVQYRQRQLARRRRNRR